MQGLLFAFLAMLTTSIEVVSTRYAMLEWGVKPTIFILIALFISAFVQINLAGYAPGAWFVRSLRQTHTWVYTLCQVVMNICGLFVLYYITTTEAFFLQRFSIIAAVAMAWIFLNRHPRRRDWPAIALIMAALGYILGNLDPDSIPIVSVLLLVAGFCNAGRTIVSETHPTYLQAGNILNRLRVTGIILLLTSLSMIGIMLLAALAKPHLASWPLAHLLPDLANFRHGPTFVFALFIGIVFLPLDIYANFRAAALLNTERLLMTKAALPFTVLALEVPVSMFSENMALTSLTLTDCLAGGLIVAASTYMMLGRRHKTSLLVEPIDFASDHTEFNTQQAETDLNLVRQTLSFTGNNSAKAAKLLGLPEDVLNQLLADPRLRLTDKISAQMQHNFSRYVAGMDPLTGLMARGRFVATLTQMLGSKTFKPFVLFYLDLNNFKPVNDTHGHAAGDEVLKHVGARLTTHFPKALGIARLGGDEFALALPQSTRPSLEDLAQKLATELGKPITLNKGVTVQIGASIGHVVAHKNQTAEDVLKAADSTMYQQKRTSKTGQTGGR